MTIKEIKRNLSLIELGFKADDKSQQLYNYLTSNLSGLNKYIHNNPIHRRENQFFYGKGDYDVIIEIQEDTTGDYNYSKYLLCTREVFDSIMEITSPGKWNDNLLESILKYWLGKEYGIEFTDLYEMVNHSNSVKFKLVS